jgi:phosphonate transport system substrate-binding protein
MARVKPLLRSASMDRLRLITYLAPSIPAELFHLVARDLEEACGVPAEVVFEERISGPLEGDDEPFTRGGADVGFLCAPSYRWLREARKGSVELLPLPVPTDERAAGRPVYFSEVIVPAGSAARSLGDLRGARWAYNDRNSRSGWFSMIERIAPLPPEAFFGSLIDAGSHVRSIELVASGEADGAAIDSNALRLRPAQRERVRILDSWGPFAIQPAIIRAGIDGETKRRVAGAMLTLHERHASELARLGVSHFVPADDALY